MTYNDLVKGLDQMEKERRELVRALKFLTPFLMKIGSTDASRNRPEYLDQKITVFSVGDIKVANELRSTGVVTLTEIRMGSSYDTLISSDRVSCITDEMIPILLPLIGEFISAVTNRSAELRNKLLLVEAAAKRANK